MILRRLALFAALLLAPCAALATTWSTTDKTASITLSGGNDTATVASAAQSGVRSTTSKSASKIYMEFTSGPNGGAGVGFANSTWSETDANGLGGDLNSVGIAANGQVFINNAVANTVASFANGDVVSMAIDFGGQKVAFRTNAGNWNNNVANDPATGATSFSTLNAGPYFAAFGDGSTVNDAATANFGGSAFAQSVPSGYVAWDAAACPQTLALMGVGC